jgi:hypothetical protein
VGEKETEERLNINIIREVPQPMKFGCNWWLDYNFDQFVSKLMTVR